MYAHDMIFTVDHKTFYIVPAENMAVVISKLGRFINLC